METRLDAVFRRAGLSPTAFAHAVGIPPNTVYRWRAGQGRPQERYHARLAAALESLGCTFEGVFGGPPGATDPICAKPPLRLVGPDEVAPAKSAEKPVKKAAKKAAKKKSATPPAEESVMPDRHALELLDPEDLAHWNLPSDPFDEHYEADDLWLPPHLERIERMLLQAVRARRITALVAPPGAGKTSMLRRMHARAGRESKVRLLHCASLDRAQITHATLASAILRDLLGADRDYSGLSAEARSELLRKTLDDVDQAGLYPVLLIDEAHRLTDRALIAIKEVWDSHTFQRKLGVVLVGQVALEDRLRKNPAVQELLGRTQILRLPALGEHVGGYLRWRFARIGADADAVFTAAAMQALATRGEHPLWVNNVAVLAMRYAASTGAARVDAVHVGRV